MINWNSDLLISTCICVCSSQCLIECVWTDSSCSSMWRRFRLCRDWWHSTVSSSKVIEFFILIYWFPSRKVLFSIGIYVCNTLAIIFLLLNKEGSDNLLSDCFMALNWKCYVYWWHYARIWWGKILENMLLWSFLKNY